MHAFELRNADDGWEGDGERVWMEDTKYERTMVMFPQERKWVELPVRLQRIAN